jgi:hypothetical protein
VEKTLEDVQRIERVCLLREATGVDVARRRLQGPWMYSSPLVLANSVSTASILYLSLSEGPSIPFLEKASDCLARKLPGERKAVRQRKVQLMGLRGMVHKYLPRRVGKNPRPTESER